jgi:hypothetical protein
VKQLLKETVGEPDKYVYMSLFGIATRDEIDNALFQALYPWVGSKAAKIGGRIFKTALKYGGIQTDLQLSDVISKFNPRIYIFDDLERCEMSVNKVMGYINKFVEHDGCKVVIVANEEEIAIGKKRQAKKQEEYRRRREKIVGKTLKIQSVFSDAFRYFVTEVDHSETKSLFEKHIEDIASIYKQSELNNLRILQQTMWDFERIFRVLTNEQRQNQEAMSALFRLIVALSFEIKAGRLSIAELSSRTTWIYAAMLGKDGDDHATRRRYPQVDLGDTIVSNEVLIDVLVNGIVDKGDIRSCLDQSQYFIKSSDELPWVTVWHMFDRTDAEFQAAHVRMEEQFVEREFTNPGELLHVLALRLYLSRNKVSEKTQAEIVDEGKRYIDDLYAAHRLDLSVPDSHELRLGAYAGLGFTEGDNDEFRELFACLQLKIEQAIRDTYPQEGLSLLAEMETDPDLYLRHVCLTNSPDNRYHNVPVLASIDSDRSRSWVGRN